MEAPPSSSLRPEAKDSPARLKVILLGETGVGKTSLLNRYVAHSFTYEVNPTTVGNLDRKEIVVDDTPLTLEIWDISGQESFQDLGMYYAWLDGCVLVYDVNSKKSFEALEKLHSNILDQVDPSRRIKFPILLIGNKIDLVPREVLKDSAMLWCAAKGNIPYFETSAKENYSVDYAFLTIAKAALAVNAEREQNFPAGSPSDEKGNKCNIV